ncbi:hypothetical protein THIOM_001815 [Candidatus Thiomargarita nelsonii]|uniref:Uncharacterized protein n=1 Tax=Candidatus Thiomargarita nelsonii TaxID=1003181 RepID=A0A176S2Z9_9GAMM|nr:hypothetical protein THIOM_001815 [Candidatus Thiomargarita nelsonii]
MRFENVHFFSHWSCYSCPEKFRAQTSDVLETSEVFWGQKIGIYLLNKEMISCSSFSLSFLSRRPGIVTTGFL